MVQPAELETTDLVDAGLRQVEVELVVVSGHRLHGPDQMAVRIVEAEAVVDIDGGDVKADVAAGRHPVRRKRPEELTAGYLHHGPADAAAGREREIEERDPYHEHADH